MGDLIAVKPNTPEFDRAVEILAAAFYTDPAWSWAFPDDDKRLAQHARFWSLLTEGAVRYPYTFLDSTRSACAVWIPPGMPDTTEEQGQAVLDLVDNELGEHAAKVRDLFTRFDEAHPQQPPHFFLTLLGTDPEQWGHGIGLRLLGDTLEVIDREGVPAYLEASNPGNVPLYERYGFKQIGSFDVPDGGLTVATMWREAYGS